MALPKRAICGDCAVSEGQIHMDGCDMERCAFCGHQRISCGCSTKHFYPTHRGPEEIDFPRNFSTLTREERAALAGLPVAVYCHGLPPDQQTEWDRIEAAKGRVPFIMYPNICRRCGERWPEMFKVPDEEWEKYVEIAERHEMLCRSCYDQIKGYVDMKLVIIESPYKGDVPRNTLYLRSCIRDCINRLESPYASHRMLTDALDDDNPVERRVGIEAGLAWRRAFMPIFNVDGFLTGYDRVLPVFYVDLGWSSGMWAAQALYDAEEIAYETRTLPTDDPFFRPT